MTDKDAIQNTQGEDASKPETERTFEIDPDKIAKSESHKTAGATSVDETKEDAPKKKGAGKRILGWAIVLASAIILSYFIRFFVMTPYEIPSPSMYDTIDVGDRVMSERVSFYFSDPQPGQIVTFADPDPSNSRTLIKRVIATEGQTIDIANGEVYVDGELLDEPYTDGEKTYPLVDTLDDINIDYPYTIPEDHVWVMGDNRDDSADSRYFGPVPNDTVTGRAFLRYWPFDKFGTIE